MAQQQVYIAGDWHEAPVKLGERFEKNGWNIVDKWWDHRFDRHGDKLTLMEAVKTCDLFVLDLRSSSFDKAKLPPFDKAQQGGHHFAGSHVGLGMELMANKRVAVVLPVGAKPYTSLVNAYCTHDVNTLFPE